MESKDKDVTTEKKPMTTEERLQLAAKLDKELDDFIAGLEKRSYTEGWPEDRWQEEMEKHPFFMTKSPEEGQLSPLLEGIQQLKYDENENTPLELAISYKEDGNFNFKCKKYRMAIISYTEGILKHCGDSVVESQLYSNRAAAHFHLGNYRSCLADCRKAISIRPESIKAQIKAAESCLKLKRSQEAIDYCDKLLESQSTNPFALKIRAEAVSSQKIEEKNRRKEELEAKKLELSLKTLMKAVSERKIPLELGQESLESLKNSQEKPVLEQNELSWPVFFLYPEYSTSDYIEQFHENSTFLSQFEEMFASPPPWDVVREYQPCRLTIYFEGFDRSKLHPVNPEVTLGEILKSGRYLIRDWKLSFLVFVKGSRSEKNFLMNYTVET